MNVFGSLTLASVFAIASGLSTNEAYAANVNTDMLVIEDYDPGTTYYSTFTDVNGVQKGVLLKKGDGSADTYSSIADIIPRTDSAWQIKTGDGGSAGFDFDGDGTNDFSVYNQAGTDALATAGERKVKPTGAISGNFYLLHGDPDGGAINNEDGNTISSNINANFIGNRAVTFGGAIYTVDILNIRINSNFIGNTAGEKAPLLWTMLFTLQVTLQILLLRLQQAPGTAKTSRQHLLCKC